MKENKDVIRAAQDYLQRVLSEIARHGHRDLSTVLLACEAAQTALNAGPSEHGEVARAKEVYGVAQDVRNMLVQAQLNYLPDHIYFDRTVAMALANLISQFNYLPRVAFSIGPDV